MGFAFSCCNLTSLANGEGHNPAILHGAEMGLGLVHAVFPLLSIPAGCWPNFNSCEHIPETSADCCGCNNCVQYSVLVASGSGSLKSKSEFLLS